jgi:signal transduction histidine kinase
MKSSYGKVDTLGLQYFGSMTASISHEIKNALAIINENAGLMGDLIALTERGRPLDPDRLKTISENIRRRVQHADDITRRLNRFAHSINGKVVNASVREIIESTVALANRIAAMKGITFTVPQDDSISITTIPFVLQNMLWICFDTIIQTHKSEENVNVDFSIKEVDFDVKITMKFSRTLANEALLLKIIEDSKPILLMLKAHIEADSQNSMLHIKIPQKFIE